MKKDVDSGNIIPVAGATFQILNAEKTVVLKDNVVTDENGKANLAGTLTYGSYYIRETKPPAGYFLPNEVDVAFSVTGDSTSIELPYSDPAAMGSVSVNKSGEFFTGADTRSTDYGNVYMPLYQKSALAGVTFQIIAAEDIVTPDGTKRYGKDDVVTTMITNESGVCKYTKLYLGSYRLIETNVPTGFVMGNPIDFEITYDDMNYTGASVEFDLNNNRQKAQISFAKDLEMLKEQTSKPFSEIVFGLYAEEDIKKADGTVLIPKDGLLEYINLDTDGNGRFNVDIPVGRYYVKELKAAKGYRLSDVKYPIEFTYNSSGEEYVKIQVNAGMPLPNYLMRGELQM